MRLFDKIRTYFVPQYLRHFALSQSKGEEIPPRKFRNAAACTERLMVSKAEPSLGAGGEQHR